MLLGKKVVGISGAMYPEREGEIVKWEDCKIVGAMYYVKWEEGNEEPFFPHQFQPISKKSGIGVYYID